MFESLMVDESDSEATALPSGSSLNALAVVAELHRVLDAGLVGAADPDLVILIRMSEQLAAWAMAQQARAVARLSASPSMLAIMAPGVRPIEDAAIRSEIASCLRITEDQAVLRIGVAQALCSRLPGTLAALSRGRLDWFRARLIVEATAPIAEHAQEVARQAGDSRAAATRAAADISKFVEDRVLARAPRQTSTLLRRSLGRAVIAADPESAERRRQKAKESRCVSLQPAADAMAELRVLLPAPEAVQVHTTLTAQAHRSRARGDLRTLDQLRADALVRFITDPFPSAAEASAAETGGPQAGAAEAGAAEGDRAEAGGAEAGGAEQRDPQHPRAAASGAAQRKPRRPATAQIQVTVSLPTLLGLDSEPGELAGYGPIPAQLAREIAFEESSTWRRLVTDPLSGSLLDHGRTTYAPPVALRDHVMARDRSCTFPGCATAAGRCDLDHVVPFPRGATCACNLQPLCRRHHRVKHETGWNAQRLGATKRSACGCPAPESCSDSRRWDDIETPIAENIDSGAVAWTSPAGFSYVREPGPVLEGPHPPGTPAESGRDADAPPPF